MGDISSWLGPTQQMHARNLEAAWGTLWTTGACCTYGLPRGAPPLASAADVRAVDLGSVSD